MAAGVGRRAELEWYRMRHRFLTHIVTYLAVLAWRVWLLGLSSGVQPEVYPNRHSVIQQATVTGHSASWLTRPAKTLGSAVAAGTMRERTGAYAPARTRPAVSRR